MQKSIHGLSGAPAEEYEQDACDNGTHAGDIRNIHMALLGDGGREGPHAHHLLVAGEGKSPECEPDYAEEDQDESCYCHRFHWNTFR